MFNSKLEKILSSDTNCTLLESLTLKCSKAKLFVNKGHLEVCIDEIGQSKRCLAKPMVSFDK